MSEVNWALGAPVDVAGMVAQGFEQGQKRRRENKIRAAMAELARNPDNPKAFEMLAAEAPEQAMQIRQQRIEQAKASLGQYREGIDAGAKIIREVNPQDQAGWDRALGIAAQRGINIDQLRIPRVWDETTKKYAAEMVTMANVFNPPKETQDPGNIREFDIARQRGLIPATTTFEQFLQLKNPGMLAPVTIPENATVIAGGGGPQPGQIEDGYRFKGGNPGDPNSWEKVGDAGGNASGGFQGQ